MAQKAGHIVLFMLACAALGAAVGFCVVLALSASGDDFDTPAGAFAGAVIGIFAIPVIYSFVRRMSASGALAGLVAVGVLAIEVLCAWAAGPVTSLVALFLICAVAGAGTAVLARSHRRVLGPS